MSTPPPPSVPAPATPADAPPLPAGPEPPPRGVAVMAVVRWVILLAMTALAASTIWSIWGPGAHEAARGGEPRYYCPMHPEITSPVPGECPICHMTLEPIPRDRARPTGPMGAAAVHDAAAPGSDASSVGASTARGDDAGAVQGVTPVTLTLERQQAIGITTSAARTVTGSEALRAPAVVEAPQDTAAQVHVRAPGFIERVAVSETGVRVGRGQTLAWYYSPQVYQAQQEFLTAHRWAVRAGALGGGVAPGADAGALATAAPPVLERASRQNLELLGMSPADIDALAARDAPLRAVPIRAPAGGFVTRRAAVLGAYVTPEMSLYDLEGLGRVWVVASVFAPDLGSIRRGTTARFVPAASAGQAPITARVELVEPEVATATRTARVRLEVGNRALALRPGQYGEVFFDVPARPVRVVPRDAVVDTGTQQYVFVDRGGGYFEPRRVRTGALRDGELEVTAGLSEGERVVTRGAFLLDSESRLQAAVAGAEPASGATQGADGGGGDAGAGGAR